MVKWNENLNKWRTEHKYTSEDWNSYASARTDQANILGACAFFLGLIIGFTMGR